MLTIPSATQLLVTALIDTGAAYSILDEQFARKNRIRIQPMAADDKLHFKMANGVRCRPRGTVDLTLDIRGHNIGGTFYVLPNCPYNALIGSDFNETHGGIVNYRTSTWTISDGDDDITVDFHTVKRKHTALTVTPAIGNDGHITLKPRSVQRIPVVHQRVQHRAQRHKRQCLRSLLGHKDQAIRRQQRRRKRSSNKRPQLRRRHEHVA